MNSATAHPGASNPAPIGGRTPVQMDWENRDAVEGLHIGVRRIAEFLIRFGAARHTATEGSKLCAC